MKKNFASSELKKEYSGFERSKAVIIPCPYEGTVTYQKGTQKGPAAILEASDYMELFDDELKTETFRIGIHTKSPLRLSQLTVDKAVKIVRNEVEINLRKGKIPVCIGGEHSISIGGVQAASNYFTDISVLQLDAHYDLRDRHEGSNYNHACVARRFLEYCSLTQLGTRSLCKEEWEFLKNKPRHLTSLSIYDMRSKSDWKKKVIDSLTNNVYLTLDLDVFDPACMPSVGTPEPGGMYWKEVLDILREVSERKKIIGFDVVELAPISGFIAPDYLAAKLIYRLLGYISDS
ncbi:MAG: agmatinase [Candidatus Omnitrophica bacterium]|nr:agmatinase [Candidatus Omnitrophota bacterium]